MDNAVKTAVEHEFKSVVTLTDQTQSLALQNHIYGCFIIMQELADSTNKQLEFDMDAEFDTIGLQFGFLMDTKLIFNKYNQEYKNAWLELLLDIEKTRDMKKVDDIEDTLLETINESVPEANNFFMDAS